MNSRTVTEEEFFYFHERLKQSGARIVRCVQVRNRNGVVYKVLWLDKQ